jgi:thioredoxin-related protein
LNWNQWSLWTGTCSSAQYDSELAKEYPVASTPTWVFSYEGKKIQRQGSLSLGEIQQLLL